MSDSEVITVTQSGPSADRDVPDGVYIVTVVDLKTRGPLISKKDNSEFYMRDWIFAVEAPGTPFHERIVEDSTSMAAGPKSKQFGFLVALNGGVAPAVGQSFSKSDLVGRQALGTVFHNDDGYPKISNLSALPAAMRAAPAVAPQPAAAAAPATDAIPF